MTVVPGDRLGPYEITAKLGEGGMGEVYRARDARLERDVAIKVLPAAFVADPERLARFEREAKLLAQLNHPSIAQIYGMEASGEAHALVMELVEGPTLADRLAQGASPLDESLFIARQIAEALEEAHEKGIVHRDLKPQNVKASKEGKTKVLDFGLAKAMDPAAGSASLTAGDLARSPTLMQSPTLTAAHGTQLGVILGTAAYMAPEQARGGSVDKRADIWAFGVVLFEMLTGQRLFAGETVSDTLAAVLRAEIDWAALPAATPRPVRDLLRRCLERNPKNRLHDIADARIVIAEALAGGHPEPAPSGVLATPPPVAARRGWRLGAAGAAVGLAAGILLATLWMGRTATGRPAPALTQLAVDLPAGSGLVRGLAISPDGRQIALALRGADGELALWVRPLDSLEARKLPGTAGARFPFWAPDSRRIGYFTPQGLAWTDLAGGPPFEVAPTSTVENVRGGAWGADDVILYAPTFTGPLLAVSAKGGASTPATRIPESGAIGTHRFPSFLPDGRRFLFYASAGTGTEPGSLYLGRVGSLESKLLGPANSAAVFAEPGYLLYARGESLVAQRFDAAREELVGDSRSLGIALGSSLNISGLRSIAVSSGGTLVYRNDRRGTTEVVRVDRQGRDLGEPIDARPLWHYAPRLAPNQSLLALSQLEPRSGNGEVWIHDLARKLASRLTLGAGDDYLATWVRPESREVIYSSGRTKAPGGLYRLAIDRPGEGRLTVPGQLYQNPCSVTPDGRRLVFERTDGQGKQSLWIRDLEGQAEATPIGDAAASEFSADLSPDGRWLAFVSDATRSWEVYIRRLDDSAGAIRISNEGGLQPVWRADGRELFYVDPRGRLLAVPIAAGDPPRPGAPAILFDSHLEEAVDRQYDVFADGQSFVLNRALTTGDTPTVVVLDWAALLDRKAP
jgi:Tol biopolymer transport system component